MISEEELEKMEIEDFVGCYAVCTEGGDIRWIRRHEMVDEDGYLRGTQVWYDGDVWGEDWWHWDYRFKEGRLHFRTLEDVLEYFGEGEALRLVEEFL